MHATRQRADDDFAVVDMGARAWRCRRVYRRNFPGFPSAGRYDGQVPSRRVRAGDAGDIAAALAISRWTLLSGKRGGKRALLAPRDIGRAARRVVARRRRRRWRLSASL